MADVFQDSIYFLEISDDFYPQSYEIFHRRSIVNATALSDQELWGTSVAAVNLSPTLGFAVYVASNQRIEKLSFTSPSAKRDLGVVDSIRVSPILSNFTTVAHSFLSVVGDLVSTHDEVSFSDSTC